MAIGIHTTHLFTLNQLALALNKRKCVDCRGSAPCHDVFTLKRQCLLTDGGRCEDLAPYLYKVLDKDWERLGIPEDHIGRVQLPLFRPLPGHYWHGADGNGNDLYIKPGERIVLCEGEALEVLLEHFGHLLNWGSLDGYNALDGYEPSFWHLSAV
jgi:hypothetical protein